MNDFTLMQSLLRYPHEAIRAATTKKLAQHLWYLSEDLILLALFDDRVSAATKSKMVDALEDEEDEEDLPSKRAKLVSPKSRIFLQKLAIPTAFLQTPPETWLESVDYQQSQKRVASLAVVNDRAERGVALIQDFNKKLTRDEDQLQFLLQVVADHRQQFPNCKKETLAKNK